RPAESAASSTRPGAARAASASGPPNDATATAANAHGLMGRPPSIAPGACCAACPRGVAVAARGGATGAGRGRFPPPARGRAGLAAAASAARGRARRAAVCATGRRSAARDRATGRCDQPPLGAEAVAALALDRALGLVSDEVIQRVTLVGHLLGAVRAGGGAE